MSMPVEKLQQLHGEVRPERDEQARMISRDSVGAENMSVQSSTRSVGAEQIHWGDSFGDGECATLACTDSRSLENSEPVAEIGFLGQTEKMNAISFEHTKVGKESSEVNDSCAMASEEAEHSPKDEPECYDSEEVEDIQQVPRACVSGFGTVGLVDSDSDEVVDLEEEGIAKEA